MTAGTPHPLDPLTAEEFRQVAAVLRREHGVGDGLAVRLGRAGEPAKDVAPAARRRETGGPRREALAVCWNRGDGQAYRAVVSLADDAVASWEHLPGQQPNMTVDEWHECDEMLREHPRLARRWPRRGITDLSLVLTDVWAYGAALVPERYRGLRLGWSDVWCRGSEQGNPYAHHLSRAASHRRPQPDGAARARGRPAGRPAHRPAGGDGRVPAQAHRGLPLRDVQPLHVSQPEGVSFTLDGYLLCWQNWQLRLGFNYREGLVLHTVGFTDDGRAAAGRAPALVRRDGGPVPGRLRRPLPPDRVRHRRVGPRAS